MEKVQVAAHNNGGINLKTRKTTTQNLKGNGVGVPWALKNDTKLGCFKESALGDAHKTFSIMLT